MKRGGYVRFVVLAGAIAGAGVGCGAGTTEPGAGRVVISVSPSEGLIVGTGEKLHFTAEVRRDGRVTGETVTWSTSDPAVASVDSLGNARGLAAGRTEVRAASGTSSGTATLEVYVPPSVSTYLPGESYLGRNGYTEYVAGDLPVVLTAPHGGDREPSEIPDRTFGVVGTDRNTRELTLTLAEAIRDRTGRHPHVIINHLHRSKHDANREIVEAAQGNPFAEQAWREFHGFTESAKGAVAAHTGLGLLFDMHGHAHPVARVELGYLLTASELNGADAGLDSLAGESSLRDLASRVPIPFSALVRGPTSFGSLLSDDGVRAVPSGSEPGPGNEPYFTGGYITRRHGSQDGGAVSAIQLEHPFPGLRDTEANRAAYVATLADVLEAYLLEHLGMDWRTLPAPVPSALPASRPPP